MQRHMDVNVFEVVHVRTAHLDVVDKIEFVLCLFHLFFLRFAVDLF